jgi:hypothetical protein
VSCRCSAEGLSTCLKHIPKQENAEHCARVGGAAAAGPTDWGPTSDIIALRQRLRKLTNKVMAGDESCMEEFDKTGDVCAAHPDQVRG